MERNRINKNPYHTKYRVRLIDLNQNNSSNTSDIAQYKMYFQWKTDALLSRRNLIINLKHLPIVLNLNDETSTILNTLSLNCNL